LRLISYEKEKKWPEDWQEVNPGCMVFRPGSAREYHTGSWRAQRPVYDNSRCINVVSVIYFALRDASLRMLMDTLWLIWIIARDAGSAPMSAGRAP